MKRFAESYVSRLATQKSNRADSLSAKPENSTNRFCSVLSFKKVGRSIVDRYRFMGLVSSLIDNCNTSAALVGSCGSLEFLCPNV